MKKTKRDYQIEAENAVFDELSKPDGSNRQLLVLATGLGKTFIAGNIIERRNQRTLWLTHTEDLIDQSAISIVENLLGMDHAKHISDHDGFIEFTKKIKHDLFASKEERHVLNSIGLIKRELFDINKPIVVASVQTIVRRLSKINPDHFDLIIVDEAHLSAADTWTKVIEHFNFNLLLGLTATPHRADGISLTNLFDKIVFERNIDWGIKNGYLCELDARLVRTTSDISKVSSQAGDLNVKQLGKEIDTPERNELIVEKYIEYASGRQFLAFALNVEHAKNLCQSFNDKGIKTTFVVADENECPDRRDRIDAFKNNEYVGLVNVNILTAGFDHPDVSCIIMARPTKSLTLYLQCIGRGTRLKSTGENCIILDIVDVTGKHSLINTWTLDKGKRIEDFTFITREKREALIEQRDRRKMDREILNDQKVDLMRLPEAIVYQNESNREKATEAQLSKLQTMGFDIMNAWTKGQVAEIFNNQDASYSQIQELREWGYDVSGGATYGQYRKAQASVKSQSKFKSMLTDNAIKLPFKNLK